MHSPRFAKSIKGRRLGLFPIIPSSAQPLTSSTTTRTCHRFYSSTCLAGHRYASIFIFCTILCASSWYGNTFLGVRCETKGVWAYACRFARAAYGHDNIRLRSTQRAPPLRDRIIDWTWQVDNFVPLRPSSLCDFDFWALLFSFGFYWVVVVVVLFCFRRKLQDRGVFG